MYQKQKLGFTIVELLVVIVVIGILAALTVVAYSGVTRNAEIALVKDSLKKASSAMATINIEQGVYPSSLPADKIRPPTKVGLALTTVTGTMPFCINGTHSTIDDIAWHIDQSDTPTEGLCSGAVIQSSIIGNYNANAHGAGDPPVQVVNSSRTVTSTGGFKLVTNEAWSRIDLSWNAVPNATKYEVHTKVGSGNWYQRNATGSGDFSATSDYGAGYSGNIPAGTTSLTWTAAAGIPRIAAVVQEYRVRAQVGSTPGEWHTLSLTAPSDAIMPTVPNFAVTPDTSWSQVSLSWSTPTGYDQSTDTAYEINTRNLNGTWYQRNSTGGGDFGATSEYGAGYSRTIPLSTQSLTWTATPGVPKTANAAQEYRIRIKSTIAAGIYGPWETRTLNTATDVTLPKIQDFTVSPNAGWTQVTLNWSPPAGFGSPTNIVYEVNSRTTNGVWYQRNSTGGGNFSATSDYGAGYSRTVPLSTQSLVWTSSFPGSAGVSHEYRIRFASTTALSVYSPWTEFVLTR